VEGSVVEEVMEEEEDDDIELLLLLLAKIAFWRRASFLLRIAGGVFLPSPSADDSSKAGGFVLTA
jgi:hypothetical protein